MLALSCALAPVWAQNAIVVENQNAGAPPATWYVDGPGDPNIQGFATDTSVNRGGTVHFKIDTDATAYHSDAYRLGWYQRYGARLVGAGVGLALPADTYFIGWGFLLQWAVFDGGDPITGITLSQALLMRIGEY